MEDLTSSLPIGNYLDRILVTGHTGFKGSWVTLLLKKLKINFAGLSLPPNHDKNFLYSSISKTKEYPEYFGDISDLNFVKHAIEDYKPKIILHMAAQSLVSESYITPLATFRVNTMGTVNILDAAFSCAETEVVAVITTDKVYKNSNVTKRYSEMDSLFGQDPYSASKVAAENAISAWRQIKDVRKMGPKVLSLRAGNVVGGGDLSVNRLMPDLIRAIFERKELRIRQPLSTRPWQHVLDPLTGYLLAIKHAITMDNVPETYNFGPNEFSVSVEEVLDIIKHEFLAFSDISVKYSKENQDQQWETLHLGLDPALAMTELNWTPVWTQKQAIVSTLKWWELVNSKKLTPLEACLHDLERHSLRLS